MVKKSHILPEGEIRSFIESLAGVTGALISFLDSESGKRPITSGARSFCTRVRGTSVGDSRCRESIQSALEQSRSDGELVFSMCHARMGQVVCPVKVDGTELGHVVVCQAILEGMSEDHKDHIRALAGDMEVENPRSLVEAAGKNPVFHRSALENLGRFIQEQLAEKVSAKAKVEDTTRYLMEKYEELMFLYSITESLTPDREYRKSLSIILDRGLQKLSADSGFLFIPEMGGVAGDDSLEVCGEPPWEGEEDTLPGSLMELFEPCSGPTLVFPGDMGIKKDDSSGAILVCPIQIRSLSKGYLAFYWKNIERLGESEMKFVIALASQASSLLHGAYLYKELADLLFSTLEALSSSIDAKDPYTRGHSQRVAEYALMMADVMGYDPKFLTMLKISGLLHDFGKIGVPEKILGKEDQLNSEELETVRDHPAIGARILGKFRSFSNIVPGIRHHHEWYDGSGYPDGLGGEVIPLVGRIISIADAFDAMTTRRPYRPIMNLEEAKAELNRYAGTQFDPTLVGAFVKALDQRDSPDD